MTEPDDVDALFASDSDQEDEQQEQQQAAEQRGGSREPAAARDELGQPDDEDEGGRAASPDAGTPAEPASAVRRFAGEEEDLDDFADQDGAARREEEEAADEEELGPEVVLEAPPVGNPPDPSKLRLVRASNILGVQPKPFSPDVHELESEEYEDEATGLKRVRLASAIRWRHVQQPDGSTTRESNARFVRWSDGSLQLLLGDEVLDVAETDISGDHHFMYVRLKGLVEAQAQLATRMSFRPSSLKSAAHKRLTAVLDKRHGFKGARVQATSTVVDPSREKAERARAEEARIRDREGLAKRQEKEMRKYTRAPAARGGGGLSAAYLEAPDEEGEEADEDYEDDRGGLARPRHDARAEAEAERRLAGAKRGAPPGSGQPAKRQRAAYDLDEDEEGEMEGFIVDGDEEDEDEDAVGVRRKPSAVRRRIALSDDDDD